MTREERALRALCAVAGTHEEVLNSPIAGQLLFPVNEIIAACLAFADAELERAAGVCEKYPASRIAADLATAIRTLSTEVGNG